MNGTRSGPLAFPYAAPTCSRRHIGRAARASGLMLTALLLATALTAVAEAQQVDGRLDAARNLYTSARYEDALDVLDILRGEAQTDRKLVEKYRSLCLLALGRPAEAERAIAAVVTADPTYQPDEAEASPRVRATFAQVRRQLLPELASARYAAAKGAYDRQDWEEAEQQFLLVLALIDDPDTGGRLADLRLLAAGFHELSTHAARAAARPAELEAEAPEEPAHVAAPTAVTPVAGASAASAPGDAPHAEKDRERVYSPADGDVTPPVTIQQNLPRLPGSLSSEARARGQLEIVIDERGRVVSMTIRESIHPAYDQQVLVAARDWKYEPATYGGRPVRFRKLILINVSR